MIIFQRILVISSPSISTNGVVILILSICRPPQILSEKPILFLIIVDLGRVCKIKYCGEIHPYIFSRI